MHVNRVDGRGNENNLRADQLKLEVLYEVVESGNFAGYNGRFVMLNPAGYHGERSIIGIDGRFCCSANHKDFRFRPLSLHAVLEVTQTKKHQE